QSEEDRDPPRRTRRLGKKTRLIESAPGAPGGMERCRDEQIFAPCGGAAPGRIGQECGEPPVRFPRTGVLDRPDDPIERRLERGAGDEEAFGAVARTAA